MSEKETELLHDLLIKRAIEGLSDAENAELAALGGANDDSFDLAAAAVMMSEIDTSEPLPDSVRASVLNSFNATAATDAAADESDLQPVFTLDRKRPLSFWLGWVVASAACAALVINIATTRYAPSPTIVQNATPTPAPMTPAEAHDKMMAEPGMTKAAWSGGPEMASVSGDIVWSDKEQKGYMKFHGLPRNDASASTYQLWIFEENQGDKTPIDGGTFNVDSNGDVVIPIDAKLQAKNPKMFAVTVEKPGGVVVSKREKIAAIAKVETSDKPTA